MSTPTVCIITYCPSPELLYSSALTLQTVRVGFPNALVTVLDNGSDPKIRPALQARAAACGAEYRQLDGATDHAGVIEALVTSATGPLVVLDGDLVFWEAVEGWQFNRPLAGRLVPEMKIPPPSSAALSRRTPPRLHTSFLWIADPLAVRDRLQRMMEETGLVTGAWNPWAPTLAPVPDGGWMFWDVGAMLYAAAPALHQPFTAGQLDCYDHLIGGSYLGAMHPDLGDLAPATAEAHRAAQRGDLSSLRGIWRKQEKHFQSLRPQ